MTINNKLKLVIIAVSVMLVGVMPAFSDFDCGDLSDDDCTSVQAVLEENSPENQTGDPGQSCAYKLLEKTLFCSDGIVNPRPIHQRWHHAEWNGDSGFFDWNYSTVKDIDQDIHGAFAYVYVEDPSGEYTGMYLFASMIQNSTDTRFFTWKKIGIDEATYSALNPNFKATPGDATYQIKTIYPTWFGRPYKYRLIGNMIPGNDEEEQWYCWGKLNGQEFNPDEVAISWDYTVTQNKGWYGQADLEWLMLLQGGIMWNTYVHQGSVEGNFTVKNINTGAETVVNFDSENEMHSAYIDKNWGNRFPMSQMEGASPEDWAWGWYSFQDPANELSIIFGAGFNQDEEGAVTEGIFGDIRYTDPDDDSEQHVGVRFLEQDKESLEDRAGTEMIRQASDGDLVWHSIDKGEKSEWVNFEDDFGLMPFPLKQSVFVETTTLRMTLIFDSTIDDNLRFTIPGPGYIFSDIEGLGVETTLYLEKKTTSSSGDTVYEPISIRKMKTGGLEYGYLAPLTLPDL